MVEKSINEENIARNIIRFFALIVFEAGIFSGMGASLFLSKSSSAISSLAIVIIAATLAILGGMIYRVQKKKDVSRDVTKVFAAFIFMIGIILGIATVLLTGINAATLVIVLFGALLVMGIILFREFLTK
jgi:hypothetical protein